MNAKSYEFGSKIVTINLLDEYGESVSNDLIKGINITMSLQNQVGLCFLGEGKASVIVEIR